MIFIGKYRNSSKHEATKDRRAMGERESERERQTDRQTERQRERERDREAERESVCVCVCHGCLQKNMLSALQRR